MKQLIQNRVYLFNLIIFIIMWVISGFNYYMVYFQIKYMEGDFYINTIIASCAELSAYIISSPIIDRIDVRITYVISFTIGAIGSLCYIFLGDAH